MKITFSNLGAIKKTTLDLRPMTVIIGPNNSNKTYIAYSIYGLWQNLKSHYRGNTELAPIAELFTKKSNTEFVASLENLEFVDKLLADIDRYINSRVWMFLHEINEYFQDTSLKIFSQTAFALELTKENLLDTIKNLKKTDYDATSSQGNLPTIYSTLSITDTIISIKTSEEVTQTNRIWLSSILLGNFAENLINTLFNNPLLFPAERNSFVITYKMLNTRRFRILRENQRRFFYEGHKEREIDLMREQGDIRYPQPIEDFLDFLTDVEFVKKDNNSKERIRFNGLADKIEEKIQEKNRTNFKLTKLGGKEIKVNVKKGLNIDLYNASSSIKQLTPLLLYLRYRAQENDLLIIDEPEMNLHPESQAKLLEVLGMLVNAGVNVLLTTHSPYFMSHLNNLISGDMTDEKIREKQAKSLYLEDARAFLSPDDVSAYEMKKDRLGNQTLHNLYDEEYGIRWDTLSDVSADIQQKFFEIYEKGEKTSNGQEE